MTPGPDQIVACPRCHRLAKYMTLMSGNTFGARVWTDGKRIAPMLPHPPAVVKCRHCAGCYWLEDAKKVGELEIWGDEEGPVDPAWKAAEYVEEPTEEEYYSAIGKKLAKGREQERSLRTLAWWRRNDAFRDGSGVQSDSAASTSAGFRDNLTALEKLLDADDEDDLGMKAELLRELGDFEAAVDVLNRIGQVEYTKVVRQLRDLCNRGDAGVRELRFDD